MKETTMKNDRERAFDEVASKVGGELGREIADALAELYSIYTPKTVEWLANLYDAERGGFYYSVSARDNDTVVHNEREYKLLPDAESTCQAFTFMNSSGMMDGIDGGCAAVLPDWMKSDIAKFMKGLQDPDGYFYHEQWGKEIGLSRRARDLNWCTRIIGVLGETPNYPTIFDKKSGETTEETLIPEHLSSPEAFAKYLEGLNIAEKSYNGGNALSAQSRQISACGLLNQAIEFLNSTQHADTGLWHHTSDYYGVNGLMKISGVYSAAKMVLPHSIEAANSAFDAIISDEPINSVVSLWNTWEAITRIVENLRKNGGEDGERMAREIYDSMRRRAPEAIRRSKEKIEIFKKEDGGFSYKPDYASPTSQGVPVCIPYLPEGDVNATVISVPLLVKSIFAALDLKDCIVPIYGSAEREKFLEIIESKKI